MGGREHRRGGGTAEGRAHAAAEILRDASADGRHVRLAGVPQTLRRDAPLEHASHIRLRAVHTGKRTCTGGHGRGNRRGLQEHEVLWRGGRAAARIHRAREVVADGRVRNVGELFARRRGGASGGRRGVQERKRGRRRGAQRPRHNLSGRHRRGKRRKEGRILVRRSMQDGRQDVCTVESGRPLPQGMRFAGAIGREGHGGVQHGRRPLCALPHGAGLRGRMVGRQGHGESHGMVCKGGRRGTPSGREENAHGERRRRGAAGRCKLLNTAGSGTNGANYFASWT